MRISIHLIGGGAATCLALLEQAVRCLDRLDANPPCDGARWSSFGFDYRPLTGWHIEHPDTRWRFHGSSRRLS